MKLINNLKLFVFATCVGLFPAANADTALFNGLTIDSEQALNSAEAYERVKSALESGEPQLLIIEYKDFSHGLDQQQRLADYDRVKGGTVQSFSAADMELVTDYSHLPMSVIRVDTIQGLEQLMGYDQIKAIYENTLKQLNLNESLPLIDQPAAAASGFKGDGTAVAVLDTGVDYTRAAFGSCTAPGVPAATCKVVYAQDFAPDDGVPDDDGHGTNVAGISLGVAPETSILALDVFTGAGAFDSHIIAAINWSIANQAVYNIAAINMSLGGSTRYSAPCTADSLSTPVTAAKAAGIFVAVASGNDGDKTGISSPACVPDAISVGAVYDYTGTYNGSCSESTVPDQVTCFSNSAAILDLLAPGAVITAAGITTAGTSQATPHVAGAAAVLAQAFPGEPVDQWLNILETTGVPITDVNAIIRPRIDLSAAVVGSTLPALSISDVALAEGDAGETDFVFTVSRTDDSTDVTVDYTTLDGTAMAPGDYPTGQTGTVSFSVGGVLEKTVTIKVKGDTTVELDETFAVALSNPAGAVISDAEGLGTILNDDSASVTIDDINQDEGDSGIGHQLFTISLSAPVDVPVLVDVATAPDTAGAADFNTNTDTLEFSPGEQQKTFSVEIQGDLLVELDERLLVNLSNLEASGRSVTIGDDQGLGGITNDDSAALTVLDADRLEGDFGVSWLVFEVQLSSKVDADVEVEFNTADDSAVSPDDYTALTKETVIVPAGLRMATVEVEVAGDLMVELDEQFLANLSNLDSAGRAVTLTDAPVPGTGTILNDDTAVLSINDMQVAEGNSGDSSLQLTASLSRPVDVTVTVDFASADGTASTGDNDYKAVNGAVTFAAGSQQQTIEVMVVGDTKVELDEVFVLDLTNLDPGGRSVVLSDAQGLAGITNDDSATVSIDDVSHDEGNTGTTNYDFTVSLSGPVDADVTFDNATADDTATLPDDYFAISGKSVIAEGTLSKVIRVQVKGDRDIEPDERFLVNLSGLSMAGRDVSFSDAQGDGQILNDDYPPGVSVMPDASPMQTSEDGDTATFSVRLDSAPVGNVNFRFDSSRPDEGTVNPETASFDSSDWQQPKTVTITGQDDDYFDGDQDYKVTTSITLSTDAGYPAGEAAELDVTNLDNNQDCTGDNLILRPEDVPEGIRMNCVASTSITLQQGVRVERGGAAEDANVDFTAPVISVPMGEVGVEDKSILILRNPDPD